LAHAVLMLADAPPKVLSAEMKFVDNTLGRA
jgi:hypothetical protein